MTDEERILKGCIKNDRKSQVMLYEKYAPLLASVCYRYVNNSVDVDEILQESFIRIYKHIQTFSGKGSLIGWMKQITVNCSINHYHKRKKLLDNEDLDLVIEYQSSETIVDENSILSEEQLLNLIHALPDKFKLIFNLIAIEGYSINEVSEMLEMEYNTCKSYLRRARLILIEKINQIQTNSQSLAM